jgi:hypothetical protein
MAIGAGADGYNAPMKLPARRCEVLVHQIARHLSAEGLATGVTAEAMATALREALLEDLSLEDRLNDEVRQLLAPFADQMRQTGVDYHEAFKKAKSRLVRERKLVL